MKLVIQRVLSSSVHLEEKEVSRISKGMTVLFGAEKEDTEEKAIFLAKKILNLRIFSDDKGKMNRSCLDIGGEILVVSQFTLAGDCTRGRRPGFDRAAEPAAAEGLYRLFIDQLATSGLRIVSGIFGADMRLDIQNCGPVTFVLER